jgi:hypothetical protein
MQYNKEADDTPCNGDCLECPYLFRFDICSPEYSTYFIELNAEIAARRRRDSDDQN